MAKLFLINGYIASGKTTYAKRLESETNAVRFTLDEWMVHFYGDNPPVEKFAEYEENIKSMIWAMAENFLTNNISVILDYGFWKRCHLTLFSESNDSETFRLAHMIQSCIN